MARILSTKDRGVTVGVVDKGLRLAEDYREVTFEDFQGTPHTVYAHVNGPWQSPEDIVAAWYAHELHADPVPHDAEQVESAKPEGGWQ